MQPFARLHQLCLESVPALSPANNCIITFAQSGVTAQDSKYSAVLEKNYIDAVFLFTWGLIYNPGIALLTDFVEHINMPKLPLQKSRVEEKPYFIKRSQIKRGNVGFF